MPSLACLYLSLHTLPLIYIHLNPPPPSSSPTFPNQKHIRYHKVPPCFRTMGNTIMLGSSKKRVKLMKIDGETLKLKPPLCVGDVLQNYPNHVVMDSESVRSLGTKARPLDDDHVLKAGAKKLYFLVELPKLPEEKVPRRVRSGIQMGAKERLEGLMLSKRSVSDLTFVKGGNGEDGEEGGGLMRVKMRLPKSQVTKLVQEGAGGPEVAEKIIGMCLSKREDRKASMVAEGSPGGNLGIRKPGLGSIEEAAGCNTARQKRVVRFQPMQEVM